MKKKLRRNLSRLGAFSTASVFLAVQLFLVPAVGVVNAQEQGQGQEQVQQVATSKSILYVSSPGGSTLMLTNGDPGAMLLGDSSGSTRVIESANQQTSASQKYYPYGQTQDKDNSITDKQFGSHRNLADAGIYHAGARFYNPQMGIFTSADTKEGPNKYAYAGANPIANTDPSGNFCIPCLVGIAALIGMMTTSPMGGSPADTPGELAQMQAWEADGGPQRNYFFSRMVPGLGQAEGLTELASGTDAFGKDVGTAGQVFNVIDALGGANYGLGLANKSLQRARVARYAYGEALLSARSADEAEAVIQQAVPEIKFTIDKTAVYKEAAAVYSPGDKTIIYKSSLYRWTSTAQHEGVHALQYANGLRGVATIQDVDWALKDVAKRYLPIFSNDGNSLARIKHNVGLLRGLTPGKEIANIYSPFDLEMMAYGSANSGAFGLGGDIAGALSSTGMAKGSTGMKAAAIAVSGLGVTLSPLHSALHFGKEMIDAE